MTKLTLNERIARRRQRVAEQHLKGRTASAIAHDLAISVATVGRDLRALRQQWREARTAAMESARDLELARLALLESESWDGWERSQQLLVSEKMSKAEDEQRAEPSDEKKKSRSLSPAKKRAERGTRSQHGDPRYLMLIMKCIERRSRLLCAEKDDEQQATLVSSQVTVREVLDSLSDHDEFLAFCRNHVSLLDFQRDAPANDSE